MDLIITILPVATKDLPIFPRFTPYDFLSRCKFSTLTTRQPMVEFYLITFPRFPLRKKEHKSYFGKNRIHDFRTSEVCRLTTRPLGRREGKNNKRKSLVTHPTLLLRRNIIKITWRIYMARRYASLGPYRNLARVEAHRSAVSKIPKVRHSICCKTYDSVSNRMLYIFCTVCVQQISTATMCTSK